MFWLSSDIKQVSIKNVAIGIFLLILAGYGYFGDGSGLLPELNDKQNMLIIAVIGFGSLFYGVKDYFSISLKMNRKTNRIQKSSNSCE
ncbi:hypothetical protein [Aliamphritea spongicola]|nr:hypothetical protein [Aliamphritea spongicola]